MVQYPDAAGFGLQVWCVQDVQAWQKLKGLQKWFRFFGALTGLSILKIQMECELTNRMLTSIGLGKMIFVVNLRTYFGIEVYVLNYNSF